MVISTFIQSHLLQVFSEKDHAEDYSVRDALFIQSLKALESVMDIDAYILDYMNKKIVYITEGAFIGAYTDSSGLSSIGFDYLERIVVDKDKRFFATINAKVFDFFYSLPLKRRMNGYYTHDLRINGKNNKTSLVNLRVTPLDLTESGAIRLSLSVMSYPTSDKPGNAYIKMTDHNTIYKFLPVTQKFAEVKTEKLTSTGASILKLSANGKTAKEIAEIVGISVNTVKYHKKRIFAQLDVRNTAEAIQWMNNQKKMVKR